MNDVFKFEQQEGERELVLLVGPRGPLPHQRYATLADIAAALAEKELCVVPKGRHDWVFGEEVMKRDEEIARLTARVVELEASRERILERTSTDILDLDEAAEDRAERIVELEAQLTTEKAAVGDYARLWEELTNQTSELRAALTAEQQRRQEVERDRDGWKRAAESQNRQWSKKCAQLTDVRAELERAERELAACRKVVEALQGVARTAKGYLRAFDSGEHEGIALKSLELALGALPTNALASAHNEVIGKVGSAVERDDETVRGFDSRSAHPVASLDESSPVAEPSTPSIAYGDTVRIRGMYKRCGDLATVIGLYPKGCATVRIHGAEQPRNGEVYPAYPLEDLEKVEPNPSKSSNGSPNPPGIPESSILASGQSAGPNGGQNAAAQLRESLGAPSATRWDEMLAMVRGMRASHSEIDVRLKALSLRVAEGLEAKGTAATVPRGEVEALRTYVAHRLQGPIHDAARAGWRETLRVLDALLAKAEEKP